jgi:hypothetical protein
MCDSDAQKNVKGRGFNSHSVQFLFESSNFAIRDCIGERMLVINEGKELEDYKHLTLRTAYKRLHDQTGHAWKSARSSFWLFYRRELVKGSRTR